MTIVKIIGFLYAIALFVAMRLEKRNPKQFTDRYISSKKTKE